MLARDKAIRRISYLFGRVVSLVSSDEKKKLLLWFAAAFGAMIMSKFCLSYVPVLYGQLIDVLQLNGASLPVTCMGLAALYIAGRLVGEIVAHLQEYWCVKSSQKLSYLVTTKAFEHMLALSHDFYLQLKSGGALQAIQLGARAVGGFFFSLFFAMIPLVVESVLIFIWLSSYISLTYCLILLLLVVAYLLISMRLTSLRLNLIRNVNIAENESDAILVESLENFENIKLLNCSKYFFDKFRSTFHNRLTFIFKSNAKLTWMKTLQTAIFVAAIAVCLFYIWISLKMNFLSIGAAVAIIGLMNQLVVPLQAIGIEQDQLQQCAVDMEALLAIFEQSPSIRDRKDASHLKVLNGKIEFKDVSFKYDTRTILNHISFVVEPHSVISITGPIGAGKTSLMRLLLRFYDVTEGKIFIDNQDVSRVFAEDLRNSVSVVPQNIILFDATVADNLACFRNVKFDDIVGASKITGLHRDVENMERSYNTLVGGKGVKLSGGERQKIAITRAVLSGAKIIILDEPLNGLDISSRKEIINLIMKLKETHTIIVITHDTTLPTLSDKVIRLSKISK